MEQMKTAHENGLPPMRPLFVDFNADQNCWKIEDQFMLGPDLLVAPILYEGQQSRKVYLPEGIEWIDAWGGKGFTGGQWIEANAPIDRIPVYWKQESRAIFRFDQIE
jgi:alpha-D-xyloside xylohydrolase